MKVKCTHCGHVMETKAKTHTSCAKCHKAFNVNSKKAQVSGETVKPTAPTPPKPIAKPLVKVAPAPVSDKSPVPTQLKVEHLPEPRKIAMPEGEGETEEERGEGEGGEEAAGMIQPAGLYTIFVELPNNLYILIQPELMADLEISEAEQKQMEQTATMLYDYCVRHGIVIPDYLELLAIILQIAGFHIKRIQKVKKKFDEQKAARKPPPIEVPEGTDVSTSADRTVQKTGVDMAELDRRMKNTQVST